MLLSKLLDPMAVLAYASSFRHATLSRSLTEDSGSGKTMSAMSIVSLVSLPVRILLIFINIRAGE